LAASIFVSYRRTHAAAVDRVAAALKDAGIEVFVDREAIDPLADFPQRIRAGIAGCHAMLVWWSADYADSDLCLQELEFGWQHARRRSSEVARRIWVCNPEPRGDHIDAGELGASNFLVPPEAGDLAAWARQLAARADRLPPEGPLADEREIDPNTAGTANSGAAGAPSVNPKFTGRRRELWKIHSLCHPARIGARHRGAMVQTHGMGGIGKTELAAAYAERFAAAYPGGVYWLNFAAYDDPHISDDAAESAWLATLETALKNHPWRNTDPPALRLTDSDGRPLPIGRVRHQVQQLLGDRASLWVLDNAPILRPLDRRERVFEAWSAPSAAGRTLVTTRDSESLAGFGEIALDVLGLEDGMRLLARYRPTRAAAEAADSQALVTELGGHALALTLVGEQLRQQTHARVLADIRARGAVPRLEQLATNLRSTVGARARGIVATFDSSIARLDDSARTLLALASVCLPGEPIPRDLLEGAMQRVAQGTEIAADNAEAIRADRFTNAMRQLQQASLLSFRQGSDMPILHGLLAQAMPVLLLPDAEKTQAMQAACVAVLQVRLSTAGDVRQHATMRSDISHARYLFATVDIVETIHLGLRIGQYESSAGRFALAAAIEKAALDRCRRLLGEEHPDTLTSMNNLASTLKNQGDLSGARELQELVLAARRRILGEEHPDTLTSMNNLASTLMNQGDLYGARELQERVLAARRRIQGEEHPDTLTSMNNLAETLWNQGDLSGARGLEEQVLAARRRILGEEHPDTLTSMNNLASTLKNQGDLSGARGLEEQVLAARRRILGEEHPDTLTSMNNLASTLWNQGDLASARGLQEQVLAVLRRILGEEHPDTLTSMNNLASTLANQGDLSGARELQELVLAARRRLLGEEHPDTLTSMNNLAETLRNQGDLSGARELQELVLAARRRILGEEHPDTVAARANLDAMLAGLNEAPASRSAKDEIHSDPAPPSQSETPSL